MAGVNRATLLGNVGRDPEIRSITSGERLANFTVATSETWRDRTSGERKEKTEWHRITVWGDKLVEIVEKYVRKGDKIYIEGKIETRKWTDNAGVERYSTDIVVKGFGGTINLLGDKRRNGADAGGGSRLGDRDPDPRYDQGGGYEGGTRRDRNADLDDEIPF